MGTKRLLFSASVFLLAFTLISCGTGRHLESISVSPSTATGSAQFTATGTFSADPMTMMLNPPDVAWCGGVPGGRCPGGNINVIAMVDSTGKAKCIAGATGTTTIIAFDPKTSRPSPIGDAPPQMKIFGTATLTCP